MEMMALGKRVRHSIRNVHASIGVTDGLLGPAIHLGDPSCRTSAKVWQSDHRDVQANRDQEMNAKQKRLQNRHKRLPKHQNNEPK